MPSSLALALLLLACKGSDDLRSGLTAEISDDVATVVTVRWTTDEKATTWVEFGSTEDLGDQTPETSIPSTDHRGVVLGMSADSDVYLRVAERIDGEVRRSPVQSVKTGDLPVDVPEVAEVAGTPLGDWLLVPVLGGVWGPVMLDADNEVVWYSFSDLSGKVFRAVMAVDGESVIYNRIAGTDDLDSELVKVSLDGSRVQRIPVPGMTHDFFELDDGTIGTMVNTTLEVDGEPVYGSSLVEIDPDGTQREIWRSFDWFDPATTGGDEELDTWTHANAIDYDTDADAWLLGLRNFSAIFQIDRASGDINWGVGDDGATISIVGDTADQFLRQHQFNQVGDDGLLVFDNEGGPEGASRVVEYTIDHGNQTASLVSSIGFGSFTNSALGDVWRRDDGDTMVVISMAGEILRVAPDGAEVGRLNLGLGYAFGYGTPLTSPYGAAGN